MQRREAVEGGLLEIDLGSDEDLHDIEVALRYRLSQRSVAQVYIGEVRVGACGQEHLDRINPPTLDGVQQRREAGLVGAIHLCRILRHEFAEDANVPARCRLPHGNRVRSLMNGMRKYSTFEVSSGQRRVPRRA